MKKYYVLILSLIFFNCGKDEKKQNEDYSIPTYADIVLTQGNHPHGFTKSECFNCHNENNIHQEDRLGAPNFDIAKDLVKQSGLNSCSGCHGKNGVSLTK